MKEDGYGRIVGRLKEMIIRGGENIFPKEIEDFLNTHPDICETHVSGFTEYVPSIAQCKYRYLQVIGVPCERMGEEVCAFVRLRDSLPNISRDDIKEFCQGKLAHFKVPRYVIMVSDFPKTTSGKIQKFKLAEVYNKEHKTQ